MLPTVTFVFESLPPPLCKLCGEEILPQHSACSWLGNFHHNCFCLVMDNTKLFSWLKILVQGAVDTAVAKTRRQEGY